MMKDRRAFVLFIAVTCLWLSHFGARALVPLATPAVRRELQSSSSRWLASTSASDLLYEDQQKAMARRAAFEETLLSDHAQELKAPKLKPKSAKSGTGFGGGKAAGGSIEERLAVEQAKVLRRDGVIRIDSALSPALADDLRAYVLQQEVIAEEETKENAAASRAFFGVENARKNRCDLQLSLLRDPKSPRHVVADALQELLGAKGKLRALYENLVGLEGEFYELASVITHPGSDRQQIHPDLPFRKNAPLYVVFVALQDVDESMGPTTFLLGTHSEKARIMFDDLKLRDQQLRDATCRLATINKGDAVVFDARLLHCGNANEADSGNSRAMFNFSFRTAQEKGNLGYPGSIRPAYCGAMNLGSLSDALVDYENGNEEPFAKYGDGL